MSLCRGVQLAVRVGGSGEGAPVGLDRARDSSHARTELEGCGSRGAWRAQHGTGYEYGRQGMGRKVQFKDGPSW